MNLNIYKYYSIVSYNIKINILNKYIDIYKNNSYEL